MDIQYIHIYIYIYFFGHVRLCCCVCRLVRCIVGCRAECQKRPWRGLCSYLILESITEQIGSQSAIDKTLD